MNERFQPFIRCEGEASHWPSRPSRWPHFGLSRLAAEEELAPAGSSAHPEAAVQTSAIRWQANTGRQVKGDDSVVVNGNAHIVLCDGFSAIKKANYCEPSHKIAGLKLPRLASSSTVVERSWTAAQKGYL